MPLFQLFSTFQKIQSHQKLLHFNFVYLNVTMNECRLLSHLPHFMNFTFYENESIIPSFILTGN